MCIYKLNGTTNLSFLSRKNLKKALELVDKVRKGVDLAPDEYSLLCKLRDKEIFGAGTAYGMAIIGSVLIGAFGAYKINKWFREKRDKN